MDSIPMFWALEVSRTETLVSTLLKLNLSQTKPEPRARCRTMEGKLNGEDLRRIRSKHYSKSRTRTKERKETQKDETTTSTPPTEQSADVCQPYSTHRNSTSADSWITYFHLYNSAVAISRLHLTLQSWVEPDILPMSVAIIRDIEGNTHGAGTRNLLERLRCYSLLVPN